MPRIKFIIHNSGTPSKRIIKFREGSILKFNNTIAIWQTEKSVPFSSLGHLYKSLSKLVNSFSPTLGCTQPNCGIMVKKLGSRGCIACDSLRDLHRSSVVESTERWVVGGTLLFENTRRKSQKPTLQVLLHKTFGRFS